MARRAGGRGGSRRGGGGDRGGPGDDGVREDHVKLDGRIVPVFAGGQFEVETDAGPLIRAKLCGRMRRYRIRVILGDRVTVALSPYDLKH